MTPEEEALLKAVCDEPYEPAPRLAYAAWMEAQSPPREQGELIRLAVEMDGRSLIKATTVDEKMRLMEAEERIRALAQVADAWKADVLTIADDCVLYQGLPAGITLRAETFIQRSAELFKMAPIVYLQLTDARPHLDDVYEVPELEKVRALSLAGQGLDSDDMVMLARASALTSLWYLDLSDNAIDVDGVESLAVSEELSELTHCILDGNPGDVHERCGLEDAIVHVWMPAGGDELEAVYGRVPWLHFPEACWRAFPPNPCGPPLQ